MSITLLNGDCLEVMKDLSANSVDCFICDLPYGCLVGGGGQEKQRRRFKDGKDTGTVIKQSEGVIAGCAWDVKIDLDAFWTQVKRLAKDEHTPVLMFCTTRFGIDLINSNPSWFRYDLVWQKTSAVGFLHANKMPMRSHEMIYVFSKSGAHYERVDVTGDFPKGGGGRSKSKCYASANGMPNIPSTVEGKRCVTSVITIANKKEKGAHPTAKPIELYEWLLRRYCPAGGTVLDPTFGSANSCVAAYNLDRHAIGIEKDEEFYKKASERVDAL